MEQVYQYLTGMKFRQRVEAVIEKFNDLREDLDRERKFMSKQWSKREAQILAVVDPTVGMVGDLQGIAGKGMPEISLDMPLLDGPRANSGKHSVSEIWKPVFGWGDCYVVSDLGHVARVATRGGRKMWRPMAGRIDGNGYASVPLSRLGKQKVRLIHRVVWEAFHGPIPHKIEINHKNGIKFDNRLTNFELVTRQENMKHGFRELGFSRNRTQGAIHPKSKLWEEDVRKILELRAAGIRRHVVAEQFNVADVAIRLIEKGDNWRHLTGLARSETPAFASPPSQGEGNGRSKLKAADIPKIFEMSREGLSQRKIAKHFGVKQQAISKVLLGLRWKHVTDT